jgi:hypothetical protein
MPDAYHAAVPRVLPVEQTTSDAWEREIYPWLPARSGKRRPQRWVSGRGIERSIDLPTCDEPSWPLYSVALRSARSPVGMPCSRVSAGAAHAGWPGRSTPGWPPPPAARFAACGSREHAALPAVFSEHAIQPGERRRCLRGSARPHHTRLAAAACGSLRCLRAASEHAALPAVFSECAMRGIANIAETACST